MPLYSTTLPGIGITSQKDNQYTATLYSTEAYVSNLDVDLTGKCPYLLRTPYSYGLREWGVGPVCFASSEFRGL